MFSDNLPILVRRFSSLLKWPLAFEERRLVHVSEHIGQRDIINNARAEKRWLRDRNVRSDVRSMCVRGVAHDLLGPARIGRSSQAKFCILADQIIIGVN